MTNAFGDVTTFVPPRPFDVHAHLYRAADGVQIAPEVLSTDRDHTLDVYRRSLREWLGEAAPADGLFFAFPKPQLDVAAANRFVAEEVSRSAESRGLLLVRPTDDPAAVETEVLASGWAGFKVYHVYADRERTFDAAPDEFLPEWAWELADRHELTLMLHLVRARAIADPVNAEYVVSRCRRYPSARLVLAHAARGFCGRHTVEGIDALWGLDNVFFDTSAICEPEAFEAILRTFGPTRLMFGSDFPVSELHGRCVSIDDGFLWLDRDNVDWDRSPFARPTRVGIESLLALRQACRTLRLVDRDVERIFRDNAREMLKLGVPSSGENQAIYTRAKQRIPGGTQLLSKRPEMFAPDRWPAYYREARGCEVVDLDERRFVDLTTAGIGTCLLGFNDPDVTDAVVRRVQLGSMCTLNPPEECELADLLVELHPWAEQVRYARTGGEAMAIAVRLARAATGRDRVAFCGYHGWSDWYLAANLPPEGSGNDADRLGEHLLPGLAPAGVPAGLAGTALPFRYNDVDGLREIVRRHGAELAAVVMEPSRSVDPQPGFLEDVRQLCDDAGAALVFDEITAGWRFELGGMHLRYGVAPDVAVFAKALGNGHPMAAVIGRTGVMQAAQESFVSSTYWTEAVGPTAALATIRKLRSLDVPGHVRTIGERFRERWNALGREHDLPARATGRPALLHVGFEHPEAAALGTLFSARMLDHGFLAGPGFYPSLAHTERHLDRFFTAADTVFAELAETVRKGNVRERLGTPVRHTGFARLT